ncbi:MAG: C-GCAxxG-C-C family protein [Candidatus Gastranaerophilaceae bacterium]
MEKQAINYFKSGYSCSESVIRAAIDEGLCDPVLLSCATSFSGGISSGCLCGTVAAAQMILGFNFGRDNLKNNEICAREKAKEFMTRFKEKNKVTCCRVLSSGYEGLAKKEHCSKFVADACEIIQDLVKVKV